MEGDNLVKIDQFKRIQGATLISGEKRYPVFKGINTIGRNKIAIINIKHLNVSQNQAIIVIVDENQHFISDLNSSNGTFLHNAKLVPFKLYELTNEADLKFGDVEARYYKLADEDTTLKLQETLEMSQTQNMTQNFYASNTQLVISTSILNQSDEHNYSTISLNKKQQSNVIEDIHDMATQVEEYPQEHIARATFAKPIVKPSMASVVEEKINDIHDAPTQVIIFPEVPNAMNTNVPKNIEEDIEATQVINEECDVPVLSERSGIPVQHDVNDNIGVQFQKQVSGKLNKSSSSSEATSESTQVVDSDETTKMLNQINTTLNNKQKIVIHNSQMPSTSGSNVIEDYVHEDSFIDSTKNIGTQGVIDETVVQPDNESSNESLDIFTMQKTEKNSNINENAHSKIVPNNKDDSGYSQPVQFVENSMSRESNLRCDVQCTRKLKFSESGSETDIEDLEEDASPRGEKLKKLNSDDDSTQEIGTKKKLLRRLDSDDSDTDMITLPSKKQKIAADNVPTMTNENCASDSDTDCEEEINKKNKTSNNEKNISETIQANDNDSDTEIEDNNDEPAESLGGKISNDFEISMQLKNSSKLEESNLNDTDCIPATQDAFADAFGYQSSKQQINGNQSSEEESFKLGITQLMEDGTENKTEDFSGDRKANSDICISIDIENKQVNKSEVANTINQQVDGESELAINDSIFSKPTQEISIVRDTHSMQVKPAENPDPSKNDEIYFMPTKKIISEQDITDFKVPSKKFTFKKKTANLEDSLTNILSNNIEDDVYMVATQQIHVPVQKEMKNGSTFEQATQKLDERDNEDDVFLQATQCIDEVKRNPENIKDDDVYFLPTQQMSVESNDAKADVDGKGDENNLFMLETQILPGIADDNFKDMKESLKTDNRDQKEGVSTNLPANLNDISISDDTQSEMPFSDENVPVVPPSINSRPGNPLIHVLNKKSTTEEIDKAEFETDTHSNGSQMNISSPSRRKLTKKCDMKSLQEKIKTDKETDDSETLSQIEAFIKKPLEIVSREPRRIVEKDDVETLSQIEAFIKKPLDFGDSNVRKSFRKDQTLSDQETIRTDDVNQSIALLETKTSKVRRQPKRETVIDEIKVTVTSHRRSMSVAETTMKEVLDESQLAKKSRNLNKNDASSSSTRGKRKSEIDKEKEPIVAEKVSRRNSGHTDSVPRKSSRAVKKNENSIKTIYEEQTTSTDNSENVISSTEKSNVLSVSSITLQKKKSSTLKNAETVGKDLRKIEELDSKSKRSSRISKKVAQTKNSSHEIDVITDPLTPSKRTNSKLRIESDGSTSTPERNNRPVSNETLLSSAERSRRKQKPKVVFTMLDNPQLELYIKHLGGSVVDGVDLCTVLVTGEVKRSQKLLAAVAQGKPICSPTWIHASKKSNEFLDPWDFILADKEAESKWNFSLRESLNRAHCKKLLTNYTFQLMVSKAADVLKGAIEASGGKCVTRNPGKKFEGHFVVVASPEQKVKYSKLKKQNPNITVVEPEAIFDGVLRQELRFTKHLIA